jgi:threonyl-tRNA synthetase (EC 6.1.1.3)/Ser-tRNA(Thr) hydrolase (EC 3.1.1.-)
VTTVQHADPAPRTVGERTTGTALFAGQRDVVAMRVNGELKDLFVEMEAGDVVEPVTADSPDGLTILRHSAAHVLAQAVQQVNPDAKLGIGPPITDGFYYDFDVTAPFTAEDLRALEKAMARIVKEGQTFRRRVVTEAEARAELADQPYKLELIGLKGSAGAAQTEGASVEVGAGELTIYDNVRRNGEVAWKDLCRGPPPSPPRR